MENTPDKPYEPKDSNGKPYEPEVNDYVVWERESWTGTLKDEGWVYFKGDPVEPKKGFHTQSRYITI